MTVSTKRSRSSSGSGSRWRTRHTVAMNGRGSSSSVGRSSSQVETSEKPARSQPLGGLLGGRVVPRPHPVGEVLGERRLAGDLVGKFAKRVDVAAPAALGQQAAARLHVAMQRGEQRVVVGDPVKRGVGEDDVDGLGQRELAPGPGTTRSPGRRVPLAYGRPSRARRRRRRRCRGERAGPARA